MGGGGGRQGLPWADWWWVLNTGYGAPQKSPVRYALFRVLSHQQLMLHSDLSSGSQGTPPHTVSSLCIRVCGWTATHLKEVSIFSQGFAHRIPSVNAKWMNECISDTGCQKWKFYFYFYKTFSLKKCWQKIIDEGIQSEYNLETARLVCLFAACALPAQWIDSRIWVFRMSS